MQKTIEKNPKTQKRPSLHAPCHDGLLKKNSPAPDHSKQIARINRVIGQMEAVKRMIVEQRYCPEILIQTRAIYSAVRSLESSVLERHLQTCVKEAMKSKDNAKSDQKIKELIDVFNRT